MMVFHRDAKVIALGALIAAMLQLQSAIALAQPTASVTLIPPSPPSPIPEQGEAERRGPSVPTTTRSHRSTWVCEGYAASPESWLTAEALLVLKLDGKQLTSSVFYANMWGNTGQISADIAPADYDRTLLCQISVNCVGEPCGSVTADDQATIPAQCGDERDTMVREYLPGEVYAGGVSPRPNCSELEQHSTGYQYTTHFTWEDWNGGFSNGNPHTEFGLIRDALRTAVEAGRTIYGYAIYMSSGYRCPHGNASLPDSSPTSYHMQGRAADLYRWGGQYAPYWSEEQFNELKAIFEAESPGPVESFSYTKYSNRHYHVAF